MGPSLYYSLSQVVFISSFSSVDSMVCLVKVSMWAFLALYEYNKEYWSYIGTDNVLLETLIPKVYGFMCLTYKLKELQEEIQTDTRGYKVHDVCT